MQLAEPDSQEASRGLTVGARQLGVSRRALEQVDGVPKGALRTADVACSRERLAEREVREDERPIEVERAPRRGRSRVKVPSLQEYQRVEVRQLRRRRMPLERRGTCF